MPARNVVKNYQDNSFYHVYNQGVEKRQILVEEEDYKMFLGLLKRHLTRTKEINGRGQEYESFGGRLELEAFCLMPNNFHLLFYLNNDTKSIAELMRRVIGTYTSYFNRKYDRVGHLFQGVYKSSQITNDSDLLHMTRYIHRVPGDYYDWPYSSLPNYIADNKEDWVVPDKIYKLYDWGTYETYLNNQPDYDHQNALLGLI